MVAGEERVPQCQADVVPQVAWRMQHGKAPVGTDHRLTVDQAMIRSEVVVQALTMGGQRRGEPGHQRASAFGRDAKGVNCGAGRMRQAPSQCGMVQMGVRDKDMTDALARADGLQDRGQVGRIVRTGVDHRQIGGAHQPCVGPGPGQGRRIRRKDAADRWIAGHLAAAFQSRTARIGLTAMSVFQRILPRSLYGRAALILIVPIVMLQLVFSTEFIQRFYEDVTSQMTQGVAIDLEFLLDQIDASSDLADARARVVPLADALQITLSIPARPDAPLEDSRPLIDLSGGTIIATLHETLPTLVAVNLTGENRIVSLRFDSRVGPVQAEISRRRMSAANPHQLIVLMIFASILLTVIAYVFLRRQLRPITKLAEAAEEFGKGRMVDYRPRGAQEVRAAGRAFVDMRSRIERQIEQRTLMLSGVSHDLRTPLTRMRLALSLMPEDPEVAALQDDVLQMERMVDEFLAFVRGDAMEGSQAADAVALVRGVVERAGGAVTLAAIEGVPEQVEMRPQAVVRALENLVSNALRYGNRVEVRLTFLERSLRISVEDDGPGIPADRRDEALRPFTRLDASRDPNRGAGVGLGLSIASDIALSHGGALRLSQSATLGGLKAELVFAR